jgi:hypothetical protein
MKKIEYADKKKRHSIWKWGLLFYELSIPTMIISNIIYFVDFRALFTVIRNLFRNKPWINWLEINK